MKKTTSFLTFVLIVIFFKDWFIQASVIGGDWPYFFQETLSEFSFMIPPWLTYHGNGLGGQSISFSLDSYLYFVVSLFVNTLYMSWEIVYRFFFFGLFLVSSFFSSRFLLRTLFPESNDFIAAFTSLLYTANTYVLMMVGGGQMGIALAYACAPFMVGNFVLFLNNQNIYRMLLTAFSLATVVMFDARVAFITMLAVSLYLLICCIFDSSLLKKQLAKILSFFIGIFAITFLLQAYWIIPLLVYRQNPADLVYYGYVSPKLFEFLSFASFSQTISLLHPNWPENIFGKIYFMRPEFLLYPILAFLPLTTIIKKLNKKTSLSIAYCSVLVIVGSFLSKGAQQPFGEVNIWLYNTIPGFNFFRDPTKFYILTALAFSMLIPIGVYTITQKIKDTKLVFCLYGLFFIFFLYTINPVWLGQLGGTFGNRQIPDEYIQLKNFIYNQPEFFRVFWLPHQHKFGFYSNNHPPIDAMAFFNASDSATAVSKLSETGVKQFADFSTRYVIIPYDDAGELFVKDRKYSEELYAQAVEEVSKIQDLKLVRSFGKIKVFEIPAVSPHFYLENGQNLSVSSVSPVEHRISFQIDSSTNLIFTDKFSPYWKLILDGKETPHEGSKGQNVYGPITPGNYQGTIYFSQTKTYQAATIISGITLLATCFLILKLRFYK